MIRKATSYMPEVRLLEGENSLGEKLSAVKNYSSSQRLINLHRSTQILIEEGLMHESM